MHPLIYLLFAALMMEEQRHVEPFACVAEASCVHPGWPKGRTKEKAL